tara:strand:- start:1331 stop:2632 length:1302 start_codon:yes stop_codon:yes gene_type:complete
MIKKLFNKSILSFFIFFLVLPTVADEKYKISRTYLKINNNSNENTEVIEINNTELANKDNAITLKSEIKNLKIIKNKELKIAKIPKFKGPAEEIYNDYAESVVLIGNRVKEATGTGFFINHFGLKIITNWHVVDGAKNVDVWLKPKIIPDTKFLLNNVDSYSGKVIKINKQKDLAMIEVKGIKQKVKTVKFGSFKKVRIGETGFAIGHPEGLLWTFTSGMISQIRPDFLWPYQNSNHRATVIQTQTPINPGNSGGPLFNKYKELIGVNTFTTAKAENLNFAVSVDDLKEFINEVQKEEVESKYIKKKEKGSTWIKKKKKSKEKKSSSNKISKRFPNAQKKDSNNNGITDIWLVDENNNGLIDMVVMDLDENQIIEAIGFDENENDNCEVILFDDDGNGQIDRGDYDEDDNGSSDIIAYDYNQDGEWDKFEKVS